MVINIQLKGNSLAKWDLAAPIVVPENVVLSFESPIYKLENIMLMVTIRNRMQGKVHRLKALPENSHTVDITEAIETGELEIEISSYVANGERTKTWRTPNIVCKEVEYDFEIIPELEYIREDISNLNQAIKELTEQLKENNVIL